MEKVLLDLSKGYMESTMETGSINMHFSKIISLESQTKMMTSAEVLHVHEHVYGKVQNMDPWSMDPLRGPGPWTGSIKIWTGSMDPLFLLPLKLLQ